MIIWCNIQLIINPTLPHCINDFKPELIGLISSQSKINQNETQEAAPADITHTQKVGNMACALNGHENKQN